MKEISQKSAAEIRKILADKNLFDVDLKAVCCELYALRCEFVYYFFSTQFEKHSEEIQKQIIESAEENLIVAKYCRMFCMCAGLYESEKKEDAFLLLKKYLHKELKAKINKNILIFYRQFLSKSVFDGQRLSFCMIPCKKPPRPRGELSIF